MKLERTSTADVVVHVLVPVELVHVFDRPVDGVQLVRVPDTDAGYRLERVDEQREP